MKLVFEKLSPHLCSKLTASLIQHLLYTLQQIPSPYPSIREDVLKEKEERQVDPLHRRLAAINNAIKFVDAVDSLFDSLSLLFSNPGLSVIQTCLVFGSLNSPRRIYRVFYDHAKANGQKEDEKAVQAATRRLIKELVVHSDQVLTGEEVLDESMMQVTSTSASSKFLPIPKSRHVKRTSTDSIGRYALTILVQIRARQSSSVLSPLSVPETFSTKPDCILKEGKYPELVMRFSDSDLSSYSITSSSALSSSSLASSSSSPSFLISSFTSLSISSSTSCAFSSCTASSSSGRMDLQDCSNVKNAMALSPSSSKDPLSFFEMLDKDVRSAIVSSNADYSSTSSTSASSSSSSSSPNSLMTLSSDCCMTSTSSCSSKTNTTESSSSSESVVWCQFKTLIHGLV
eukprot:TRINITY_DN1208_c1_g1_i1.p1 TRINITY_DN1208_c1_g1~~TRINITY_DN1208_c1_g1_i1.p1  ORF type:complete len:401 (+),score=111.21 TRINITY_DN1208_c1_g1_i1:35-1237(+)